MLQDLDKIHCSTMKCLYKGTYPVVILSGMRYSIISKCTNTFYFKTFYFFRSHFHPIGDCFLTISVFNSRFRVITAMSMNAVFHIAIRCAFCNVKDDLVYTLTYIDRRTSALLDITSPFLANTL